MCPQIFHDLFDSAFLNPKSNLWEFCVNAFVKAKLCVEKKEDARIVYAIRTSDEIFGSFSAFGLL